MGFELRALVVDSGFEPLKAKPADLQSAPIGHSGYPSEQKFLLAEATGTTTKVGFFVCSIQELAGLNLTWIKTC